MSKNSGWVKVHRRIQDNCYWKEKPFSRGQAWVDLILSANYKAGHIRKRGIMVEIARGQVGASQQTLADRWGWSRGKVIRFLKELETKQQVVQQKTNVTTIITLVNYEDYQIKKTPNDTTDNTADGHQTVPEQESEEFLKKVADLKKIIKGSQDHTLVSKYALESGIQGISFEDLKVWAVRELKKIQNDQ